MRKPTKSTVKHLGWIYGVVEGKEISLGPQKLMECGDAEICREIIWNGSKYNVDWFNLSCLWRLDRYRAIKLSRDADLRPAGSIDR